MAELLNNFWLLYAIVSLLWWSKNRHHPFKLSRYLSPLGAFVWGDVPIISLFWILICSLMLVVNRTDLFILVWLVFWAVRAIGEIIYWIHEQFSEKHRNHPKDLWGHQLMPGESIYFGYQLFWQMVLIACTLGILRLQQLLFQ